VVENLVHYASYFALASCRIRYRAVCCGDTATKNASTALTITSRSSWHTPVATSSRTNAEMWGGNPLTDLSSRRASRLLDYSPIAG